MLLDDTAYTREETILLSSYDTVFRASRTPATKMSRSSTTTW